MGRELLVGSTHGIVVGTVLTTTAGLAVLAYKL
jgi:hypothetical protein